MYFLLGSSRAREGREAASTFRPHPRCSFCGTGSLEETERYPDRPYSGPGRLAYIQVWGSPGMGRPPPPGLSGLPPELSLRARSSRTNESCASAFWLLPGTSARP